MDVASISPSGRAAIYSAILDMQTPEAWQPVPVAAGDTLNSIVGMQYRIRDAPTRTVLIDRILNINAIQDPDEIRAGQSLVLPKLPKRPYGFGYEGDVYQQLDLRSPDDPELRVLAQEASAQLEPADSAAVSIVLTTDQVGSLLERLPLDRLSNQDLAYLLIRFGTETAVLEPHQAATEDSTPDRHGMEPVDTLSEIPVASAPSYAILDFFHGDCAHGDLVLEAATSALRDLGAAHLESKIEPIELDLFQNKEQGLAEIDRFVESYKPARFYPILKTDRDAVAKMPRPSGRYEVVLLYLQALLHNRLAASGPGIVSLSCSAQTELKRLVPLNYARNTAISFLAAVPNLTNVRVEDSTLAFHVPQSTLLGMQNTHGAMLIGSYKSDGAIFGMSSEDGAGVSTLADGVLRSENPACDGRRETGTSIATPRVAAHLLVAEAIWGDGAALEAREVRIRALLASQPSAEYLGRFASGGPPDIRKLRHARQVVAETIDRSVEVHDKIVGRVRFANGESAFGYSAGPLPSPHLIRGVRLAGETWWVFFESIGAWTQTEVEDIDLTLRRGSDVLTVDRRTFENNYLEIILL